jgi:hypothetical protein
MNLLRDVIAELVGMFVGDARLSAAVLFVVAVAAVVIRLAGVAPLAGGVVLLAGCLLVVVEGVRRGARRLAAPAEPPTDGSGAA